MKMDVIETLLQLRLTSKLFGEAIPITMTLYRVRAREIRDNARKPRQPALENKQRMAWGNRELHNILDSFGK